MKRTKTSIARTKPAKKVASKSVKASKQLKKYKKPSLEVYEAV